MNADIQELAKLTEFELRRIEEQRRRFGWTPWALLITLAGFAWKAFEEAERGSTWTTTLLLSACMHLCWEMFSSIREWLNRPRDDRREPGRFFNLGWMMSGTRENMLVDGLLNVGACTIILKWGGLEGLPKTIFLVYTCVRTLEFPIALLVSFTSYQVFSGFGVSGVTKVTIWLRGALFLLAYVAAGFAAWRAYEVGVESGELKLALMIMASARLLIWLTEFNIPAPIETRLVQIRRAIALGELKPEIAREWLDETLHGSRSTDTLRTQVKAFNEELKNLKENKEKSASLGKARSLLTDMQFRLGILAVQDPRGSVERSEDQKRREQLLHEVERENTPPEPTAAI